VLMDSHCHLDDPQFENDREAVIQRAQSEGVTDFVTIGCDLSTSQCAVSLAQQFPFIFSSIGVHPHEVKDISPAVYEGLRTLAKQPKVVAYGEIGLDYFYNLSPPDIQRRRFREQIALARELRLPIILHSRDAKEDTLSILREEKAEELGGVFHCFTGDLEMAKAALDLGFFLSFSGIVTFPKAIELRKVVQEMPLDRMLIETDSPYLTPHPHRGKRNEPAYVQYTARKIAELKPPLTLNEVAEATRENAKRLFRIHAQE
jgi:TatD DNase family protein